MIPLISVLAVGALAAPPQVDVLVEVPLAHTAPMTAVTVPPLGNSTTAGVASTPLAPVRSGFDAGLGVEILTGEPDQNAHLLVSLGLRTQQPVFEHQGYTFDPQIWDARADLGGFTWLAWRGVPAVDMYMSGGAGLQASTLVAPPWPTTIAPGLHGFLAMGVGNRKGRISVRGEARVSLAARLDSYLGTAQLPVDRLEWQFWPGSATASALVAFGLRPRTEPALEPG